MIQGVASGPFHVQGRILPSEQETDVYIVNGRFTMDRPPRSETLLTNGWLLPGLVDAHVHLALNSPSDAAAPAERVRASARAHLEAGVHVLREPGGPDRSSAAIRVEEGLPRVQSAGRFLAPPGGYFPGLAREVPPEGLVQAVTEEAAASQAWVKLIGDFVGPEGRLRVNWDKQDLRAAAATAHAAGARITIHAVHPDTCADAIEAGFDGIEHGSGLREDDIESLVKRRVAWCPTLIITPLIPPALGGSMTSKGRSELGAWLTHLPSVVKKAAEAGVTLLAGTDAAMTPHGVVLQEVARLVAAGVPPNVSLGAASWVARHYLRYSGIEEGAPADLVVFTSDPRKPAPAGQRPTVNVLNGRRVVPNAVPSRGRGAKSADGHTH